MSEDNAIFWRQPAGAQISNELDMTRREFRRYREALGYVVRANRMIWTNHRRVSLGDPSGADTGVDRFGLIDGSEPMIVCHNEDSREVWISTPEEVALWSAATVWQFPELHAFLNKHVDLVAPVDPNVRDVAWLWGAAR